MRRSRVVLLVHTDEGIRVTFRVVLRSEGFVVLEASNSREALEELRESVPDLLITEMRPPLIAGAKLIRTIRADHTYNGLRILALGSESSRRDAVAAGADDFQPVPIMPEQLVKVVTGLIGRA